MIPVTKPFFPPLNEYSEYLKVIWENGQLTNNGPLLQKLTEELKNNLEIEYIIPMANGTLPIQIALKIFGNNGEIITTPFSYVATTSSIIWENNIPVFCDINPNCLTIDPSKIEAKISENTKAILATHVFGNPCEIEILDKIAKKHNLRIIYDAAHCFGVKYKGKSIFSYGDASTCSFHATKLFQTGEGGAFFARNKHIHNEAYYRHNFGHDGQLKFHGLGINAKMNELQAAMGLAVLPYISNIIRKRKNIVDFYSENIDFSRIKTIKIRPNTDWNYSYYPLIFNEEKELINAQTRLNTLNIFPRRYFYPSLNNLPYLEHQHVPISESISSRVLCLPLYTDLEEKNLRLIVNTINH